MIEEETDELFEAANVEGTELEGFESAEVEEDEEDLSTDEVASIVESILFATEKPQSVAVIKQAFKGTTVRVKQIREAIDNLKSDYIDARRGFTIEEVNGGYQLRTKLDNLKFLKRMIKARSFRLSGPALEVLSIVAYKQPLIKHEIDEIRGVESGHLLRGLMDRSLVMFAGKSELPGRPMFYATTKKFLEIFGLRNIRELPSLSEIDELIPEGIGEPEEEKETLDTITESMSNDAGTTYSEGEEELERIVGAISEITTSSEFFEKEKERTKLKRDEERAQNIREALVVDEEVSERDKKWLERYEAKLTELNAEPIIIEENTEVVEPLEEPVNKSSVQALLSDEKLKADLEIFDEPDSPSKLDH